jgi:hypothetical protein
VQRVIALKFGLDPGDDLAEEQEKQLRAEISAEEQQLVEEIKAQEQQLFAEQEEHLLAEISAESQQLVDEIAAQEQQLIKEIEEQNSQLLDAIAVQEEQLMNEIAEHDSQLLDEIVAQEQYLKDEIAAEEQLFIKEIADEEQQFIKEIEEESRMTPCERSGLAPTPQVPSEAAPAWDEAVPFTLALEMDLNALGNIDAFKRDVIKDVATAAKIDAQYVKVTALRAGSVIVDMLIAKEAGDATEILRDLQEQLKFPNSLLMQGKLTRKAKKGVQKEVEHPTQGNIFEFDLARGNGAKIITSQNQVPVEDQKLDLSCPQTTESPLSVFPTNEEDRQKGRQWRRNAFSSSFVGKEEATCKREQEETARRLTDEQETARKKAEEDDARRKAEEEAAAVAGGKREEEERLAAESASIAEERRTDELYAEADELFDVMDQDSSGDLDTDEVVNYLLEYGYNADEGRRMLLTYADVC